MHWLRTDKSTIYVSNGIYDQLMSEHGEKFLSEEAQYAVDNLLDYNENAHKKAEQYQKEQGMSSDAI